MKNWNKQSSIHTGNVLYHRYTLSITGFGSAATLAHSLPVYPSLIIKINPEKLVYF